MWPGCKVGYWIVGYRSERYGEELIIAWDDTDAGAIRYADKLLAHLRGDGAVYLCREGCLTMLPDRVLAASSLWRVYGEAEWRMGSMSLEGVADFRWFREGG